MSTLQDVINRANSDRTFRTQLWTNAETAVTSAGFRLSSADLSTLQANVDKINASRPARELDSLFQTAVLGWNE